MGLVDGRVVAVCQLQSDGQVQAHLISYSDPFYEAVASGRFSGFRITRGDLGLGG